MNSIRDELISLDTNEFIFGLRKDVSRPACEILVFDKLSELRIHLPLQILLELQHNLTDEETRRVLLAVMKAKAVTWDYAPAPLELVQTWQHRGAKKGDAVIAAHLEIAQVSYFVSENRHFIAEITDLPFKVLTSEEAVQLIE